MPGVYAGSKDGKLIYIHTAHLVAMTLCDIYMNNRKICRELKS